MATLTRTLAANSTANVTPSPLARLAGPLALAAGALFTLAQLIMLARMALVDFTDLRYREVLLADVGYLLGGVVYFVAFCLLMVALVAIYGREGHRAGAFWAIGVCAAVIGTLGSAGNAGWSDVFAMPWVAEVAPEVMRAQPSGLYVFGAVSSYALFTLGWVLFGLASLRARLFPSAICFAIVGGSLLGFNASPPYGVPLGLAIAGLGVWMMRRTTAADQIAAPAVH